MKKTITAAIKKYNNTCNFLKIEIAHDLPKTKSDSN